MENKEELEQQMSAQMNAETVERIKAEEEAKSREAAAFAEVVWFEDDDQVTLRDGSVRKLPPLPLGDARRFMNLVRTVNIDAIILNFAPSSVGAEEDLYSILAMGFRSYPDMVTIKEDGTYEPNRAYMDKVIDIRLARNVIDTMLDLNALKK